MVNALDLVPRMPPRKDAPLLIGPLCFWYPVEVVLEHHIIAYGHAGEARLCKKVIQVVLLGLAMHMVPLPCKLFTCYSD